MIIDPASLSNIGNPVGFIVLEGVNGAGKSTLQSRLAARFRESGKDVLCTREPGATPLGLELRAILQEGRVGKISALAELLLFAADRAEHIEQVIKPALARKSLVICDRYFYSTLAFQGFGRGLDLDTVSRINESAVRGFLPDLVLLLDLDPAEGLRRNNRSGEASTDTFESEALAFHTRIRDGFLEIARKDPAPFIIVNSGKDPDAVFEASYAAISKALGHA